MASAVEKIMEGIKGSDYLSLSLYVCLAMVFLVIVIHFLTRNLRLVKYLPGIIAIVYGVSNIINKLDSLYMVEELDAFAHYLILLGAGVIGLIMALILGIIAKEKKPKKRRTKKK
ncbi:MAG: hypothetical protein GXZ11_05480 [Tissierellia bacterium]|nr:hypothetical protein [Tissierellia bacterium]